MHSLESRGSIFFNHITSIADKGICKEIREKERERERERKNQGEVAMRNTEKVNSHVLGSQKLIFRELKTPGNLAACLVRKTSQNEFDGGKHCLLR